MLLVDIRNWYTINMKKKEKPNKTTIEALKEYEAMIDNKNGEYKTYNSFAELLNDLKIDA